MPVMVGKATLKIKFVSGGATGQNKSQSGSRVEFFILFYFSLIGGMPF